MSAPSVRLTRARALMAAAGFAVIALVVAGCASSIDGSGSLAGSGTTTDPTTKTSTSKSTTKSSTKSQDFPDPTTTRSTSGSRSSSTSTSGSSTRTSSTSPRPSGSNTDAALQVQLAQTGASWMHAYAAADVPTFCSLSDPPSLQSVLDEKGITSCDTLTITWDTDLDLQADLAAFAIPDPTDIIIIGTEAFVLSFDVTPASLGIGINWIKQADGSWKVDASILSSN